MQRFYIWILFFQAKVLSKLVLPKGENKKIKRLGLPDRKIPSNIYTDIKDLPFDRFLQLYIDKNYHALVKHGKANILHLVKASHQVIDQYTDEVTELSQLGAMYILGDIAYIQFKMAALDGILESLKVNKDKSLISSARKLGFNYQFTDESIENDIVQMLKQKKVLMANLTEKQFEYIRLYSDASPSKIRKAMSEHGANLDAVVENLGRKGKTEAPTHKLFNRILSEIDPKLEPKDISTLRFTVLYNKLVKMNKEHGSR